MLVELFITFFSIVGLGFSNDFYCCHGNEIADACCHGNLGHFSLFGLKWRKREREREENFFFVFFSDIDSICPDFHQIPPPPTLSSFFHSSFCFFIYLFLLTIIIIIIIIRDLLTTDERR